MPRAHFYRPITNEAGDLVIGATVQVLDPATEISYSGNLYVNEDGPETFTNPYLCQDGIIDFYLDQPMVVDLKITTSTGTEKVLPNMLVDGLSAADVDLAAVIAAAEAATEAANRAAETSQGAQKLNDLTDVVVPDTPGEGLLLMTSGGVFQPFHGGTLFDTKGAAAAAEQAAKQASQPYSSHLASIAALTTTPYGRALLTLANQDSLMALVRTASASAPGMVELATPAEAKAGSDTTRAVTPAGLRETLGSAVNPDSLAPVAFSGNAADLTGTLPTSVLPPLAINEVFTPASQTAMLALSAQRGDMAIRTDNSKTYVLAADNPSLLSNWKEITGAGSISSVNGKTGAVVLNKADVGLSNVDNTSDANKPISTAVQAALNGKENALPTGSVVQYLRGDKTWAVLTSEAVGLGNVNNTSDLNKPISTAMQTALNNKVDKVGGAIPAEMIPNMDSAKITSGRLAAYSPSTSDANSVTSTGWYRFPVGSSANVPSSNNWLMEAVFSDASNGVQTIYPFGSVGPADQGRWRRFRANGAWGSWFRIEDAMTALDNRYYGRATVDTKISAAFNAAVSSGEMGYAARGTVWDTTNLTDFSTATSAIIPGLSVNVIGEGNPVDISFRTLIASETAYNTVIAYLIVNGSATGSIQAASRIISSSGSEPMSLTLERRAFLYSGSSYTFQIGISSERTGRAQISVTNQIPAELKVTRR